MDASRSAGASGNWPSTAWLPITTISLAPVMPAAARMTCSSCGRCMTEPLLQLPDLLRAQHPRERRVLAQSPGLLAVGTQEVTNLLQRAFQNLTPFRVAMKQGRSVGI